MSPRARMEYLETIYLRYKRARKKDKTAILNEFCLNCSYHRKHAIRLLNNFRRFTKPKPKKRGKPSKYNNPAVIEPLKHIWLTANLYIVRDLVSHSLAIIPLWLPSYAQEYGDLKLDLIKTLSSVYIVRDLVSHSLAQLGFSTGEKISCWQNY